MIKIGWLSDSLRVTGGAEISDNAFIDDKPDSVEVVYCEPPRRPPNDIDAFVVNNCLTYDKRWIEVFEQVPVVKHIHDLWPYGDPILRRWILENAAALIFNSSTQAEMIGYNYSAPRHFVYPPVDVQRIRQAVNDCEGGSQGTMYLGRIEAGKGIGYAVDWALDHNERIDFYGQANDRMALSQIVPPCYYRGQLDYEDVPGVLARYKAFWYTPVIDDLCGRSMVEAYAAGLELICYGDLKTFLDWVDLDKCQNAAADFWAIVLGVISERKTIKVV